VRSVAFHLVRERERERERERDWPQRRREAWITGASLVGFLLFWSNDFVPRVMCGMQTESFKDTWHTHILDYGALDISNTGIFLIFQHVPS
jgi:hypothetical protein